MAVVGTRFTPLCKEKWARRIKEFVDRLPPDTEIITAGAPGTDRTAAEYARAKGLKVTVLFPDIPYSHDPRYFLHHNRSIVEGADEVHAFWDGISAGTHHAIHLARYLNRPLQVHYVYDQDWEVQR